MERPLGSCASVRHRAHRAGNRRGSHRRGRSRVGAQIARAARRARRATLTKDSPFMCGIVGYVGSRSAGTMLIEGLKRLEYRGYDSAGIAMSNGNGLETRKAKGKISMLESLVSTHPIHGTVGIAHTRWATHGAPNELQRAPANRLLRHDRRRPQRHHRELQRPAEDAPDAGTHVQIGHRHRGARAPDRGGPSRRPLEDAVIDALNLVQGTYGIAVLSSKEPGQDRVRATGKPAPHRTRRRRELRGERRRGDPPAHAPGRLSRRRRDGRADARTATRSST